MYASMQEIFLLACDDFIDFIKSHTFEYLGYCNMYGVSMTSSLQLSLNLNSFECEALYL